MRVESKHPLKSGGWLHKLNQPIPVYIPKVKPEPEIKLDCTAIWQKWKSETAVKDLRECAEGLMVDPLALAYLGCVRASEHGAMAFPMRNHRGDLTGFRLRNAIGEKWSVKGSKQGLFYSRKVLTGQVYICEGTTDAAACLTMGLSVIGRPSCLGAEQLIADTIKFFKIREVILVPDNDNPGIRGAERLKDFLSVPFCTLLLPCKDLRQFLTLGGNKETLQSMVKNLVWERSKTPQV
jgi:hypothetical protein